jgi:hypothetical protein
MEKKVNSRIVEDIDETFLLNSIAEPGIVKVDSIPSVKAVSEEKTALAPEPLSEKTKEAKEPAKRKRSTFTEDYGSRFLGNNEAKARQCVYIDKRIHKIISEIINVTSSSDLTVGGYIDSILMDHLEANKDEINEMYSRVLENKNSKKLMDF